MNNREQRAHSAGLIEKAIPGCGRNIDTISQRTGLAGLTIRRVFDDTEYKSLLEKFEMEPFVSRIKTRQNKKIGNYIQFWTNINFVNYNKHLKIYSDL